MTLVGETLQGKRDAYEIQEVLVSGRFGETFQARRTRDDQEVILKTIRLDKEPDWHIVDAFERQSERLQALTHRYVAPYLDAVVLDRADETSLFGLVQSRVTAPSLWSWRQDHALLDLERCLDWFERALEALVSLHELDPPLIHGDLDAGNILISEGGAIQIVDFATARQELLDGSTLAGGLAVGALDYAPMEQLLGKIFPSSDLYALAMTLLAVLSGLEPRQFPLDGARADLDELLPYDAPDDVVALIRQMTEPDPQHRLQSARVALERVRIARSGVPLDKLLSPELKPSEAPAPRLSADEIDYRTARLHELVRQVSPIHQEHPSLKAWSMEKLPEYERVHAFAIARDGISLAVARDHEARLFSASDLTARGEASCSELARRIALSRDGRRVAILTGFEQLLLCEVNVSLRQLHEIRVEGMWPGNAQLCFSPDGAQVAISDDDQVNLYEVASGEALRKWEVDGQYALEFSPSGDRLIASGEIRSVILEVRGSQQAHDPAEALRFAPDGALLASSRDGFIELGRARLGEGDSGGVIWQEQARRVSLPGVLVERRVHMLRFSPDQRLLFVGCASGGFALIDVASAEVLDFEDEARTRDVEHVKLFEAGFSADSERLFVHGTLPPDEFGHERLGAVLAWRVPAGELLGALLWLDGKLGTMTALGFHGEVAKAGGGKGFSSDVWARPDVAGHLFAGRDVAEMLSPVERASAAEFGLRFRALRDVARSSVEVELDARGAANALANLSHVAPSVFERADELYHEANARLEGLQRGDYLAALKDAAFQFEVDYDEAELATLHRELMAKKIPTPHRESRHKRRFERAEVALKAPTTRRIDGGSSAESSQDGKERDLKPAHTEPSASTPRPEPTPRPKPAYRPSRPVQDDLEDEEEDIEGEGDTGPFHITRFIAAAALGFGLTGLFVYLFMTDGSATEQTQRLVFWLAGAALTAALYFGALAGLIKD